MQQPFAHISVLLQEVLDGLAPQPGNIFLDATLGGAGHSAALAERIAPGGTLIGLDRDTEALTAAKGRLEAFSHSVHIITRHAPFGNLEAEWKAIEAQTGPIRLSGALFDLGVSSYQLDGSRGFSFRRDELLDMRMDQSSGQSAAEALLALSEKELADILFELGEERWAKRIAAFLTAKKNEGRPVQTTAELAQTVRESIPRKAWPDDTDPATRTFQALRIYVNQELEQLHRGLEAVLPRLAPGGRLAVISFHSLEDRIVKQKFALAAGKAPQLSGRLAPGPLPNSAPPEFTLVTRKPIQPGPEEIRANPRSRSARLRIIERQSRPLKGKE